MAFSGVFLAVFLVTGVMAHYTSPDICKALSPKVCDNAGQVLIERPCETETHDIMIQHWPTNCFIVSVTPLHTVTFYYILLRSVTFRYRPTTLSPFVVTALPTRPRTLKRLWILLTPTRSWWTNARSLAKMKKKLNPATVNRNILWKRVISWNKTVQINAPKIATALL